MLSSFEEKKMENDDGFRDGQSHGCSHRLLLEVPEEPRLLLTELPGGAGPALNTTLPLQGHPAAAEGGTRVPGELLPPCHRHAPSKNIFILLKNIWFTYPIPPLVKIKIFSFYLKKYLFHFKRIFCSRYSGGRGGKS